MQHVQARRRCRGTAALALTPPLSETILTVLEGPQQANCGWPILNYRQMTPNLRNQSPIASLFLRAFDFRFDRATFLRPSVLALLAANVFPIVGVVALGWDVFLLLALFWAENLVIGFYTALKMLLVANSSRSARWGAAAFFCAHYGLFTLVHGVFVFAVFGGQFFGDSSAEAVSTWQRLTGSEMGWGGLALLVSHGVSFFFNYVGAREYRRSRLADVMQEPYGRVVLLHLTIIFGGFLVMLLGSPVVGLLLLVVLKTVMDLRSHVQQHDKYSSRVPAEA